MKSVTKMDDVREHIRQVARLYSGSRIGAVLNQLGRVQKRGEQYRAKCPAHDGKSTTSLSVTETEDARILIHCFGGCSTQEVLDAIGMEFHDLMPERITHNATPKEKLKWKQDAQHRDWVEQADILLHEARVLWLAADSIVKGKPLNDIDLERVKQSLSTIDQVGKHFHD